MESEWVGKPEWPVLKSSQDVAREEAGTVVEHSTPESETRGTTREGSTREEGK